MFSFGSLFRILHFKLFPRKTFYYPFFCFFSYRIRSSDLPHFAGVPCIVSSHLCTGTFLTCITLQLLPAMINTVRAVQPAIVRKRIFQVHYCLLGILAPLLSCPPKAFLLPEQVVCFCIGCLCCLFLIKH